MEVLSEGCPVRALCLPVATGEATGEAAEDVKAQGRSGSCATPARMLPFSCANITSRASTGSAQGSSAAGSPGGVNFPTLGGLDVEKPK